MSKKNAETTTITQSTLNSAMAKILAQAAITASTASKSKAKTPKQCAGGCGQLTKGGNWFPGHDGRVQGRAIQLMRLGFTKDEVASVVTCSDNWDLDAVTEALTNAREAASTNAA